VLVDGRSVFDSSDRSLATGPDSVSLAAPGSR